MQTAGNLAAQVSFYEVNWAWQKSSRAGKLCAVLLECWGPLACFHVQLLDNICLLPESHSLSPQLYAEVFFFVRCFILLALEVFVDSDYIEAHNE